MKKQIRLKDKILLIGSCKMCPIRCEEELFGTASRCFVRCRITWDIHDKDRLPGNCPLCNHIPIILKSGSTITLIKTGEL